MTHAFYTLKKRLRARENHFLAGLVCLLALAFIASLSGGEEWYLPYQWFDEGSSFFIWQLRLPRTLAVMFVGAALALCGAVMQSLFDNPLAEPSLLGIANGAAVTLVVMLLLGMGSYSVTLLSLAAIFGALLVTLSLLVLAHYFKMAQSRVLLLGIAIGILCSAVMTWAVYFSSSFDLRQLMYWMMGSFSGVDWRQKGLIYTMIPFILWLSCQSRALNLLSLGQVSSQQLGLSLPRWRMLLVIVIGILVGLSVAISGIIGFVGLIIPHLLRLSGMTDHRALLPGSALAGATILLLSDLLARTVMHQAELPIGVVTATLGTPIFIWLLLRSQRGHYGL